MKSIVIVGGGQAAVSFITTLRKGGCSRPITLIGEESYYPYQRPPLSKAYLSGEMPLDRLFFRLPAWYEENDVRVYREARVVGIERKESRVVVKKKGGEEMNVSYSHLLLATGSRPRVLPEKMMGDVKEGVYVLRGLSDVESIRAGLSSSPRHCTVVGGGYIGLEVASSLRSVGIEVSVVEAGSRILQRVACEETSYFFRELHRERGVRVLEGVGVGGLIGEGGRVTGVTLENGETLTTDMVILGVGVEPCDELAKNAGLRCDGGILVDEYGRTDDPLIYASGDCTRFSYRGEFVRIESVDNAVMQSEHVAYHMLGEERPYEPHPWFWSHQYDVKLQIAGLALDYDDVVVRKGKKENSYSHWYCRGERVIAVDAINDPTAFLVGKKCLEQDKTLEKDMVSDFSSEMKSWV